MASEKDLESSSTEVAQRQDVDEKDRVEEPETLPAIGKASVAVKPAVVFPDGGLLAWSQVLMGFLIMFSTW